jgi:hypothetical protein
MTTVKHGSHPTFDPGLLTERINTGTAFDPQEKIYITNV